MAKYTLIIRDKTYITLVQEALMQRLSLGKLINKILDSYVAQAKASGGTPAPAICLVCGRKATFLGRGHGNQTFFVCSVHMDMAKRAPSYKFLEGE